MKTAKTCLHGRRLPVQPAMVPLTRWWTTTPRPIYGIQIVDLYSAARRCAYTHDIARGCQVCPLYDEAKP